MGHWRRDTSSPKIESGRTFFVSKIVKQLANIKNKVVSRVRTQNSKETLKKRFHSYISYRDLNLVPVLRKR